MDKKRLVFLSIPLLLSLAANADVKEFYQQRALTKSVAALKELRYNPLKLLLKGFGIHENDSGDDGSQLTYIETESTLSQNRDHFNTKDTVTFPQRYWIIESSANTLASPILFYICGEATCDTSFMIGSVGQHARSLGARVVTLEHRYYGKSIPTPDLSNENLKYLSTAQALEDMKNFITFLRTEKKYTGPIVTIGGSYPGTLSAYFRQKYPNLIAGALASSGPVIARANFQEYDHHVFVVAGPSCAADMKAVSDGIEARLADPTLAAESRAWFGAERVTDDGDFLYLVADVAAAGIQYGMRDKLCNALGAATSLEAKTQAFVRFAKQLFSAWGMTAYEFSVASAADLQPDSYLNGFGYRSWLYQSCTEYGFFQNSYQDPRETTRSLRINPEYHLRLCNRLFGITTMVDESRMNQYYYRPLLSGETASKIFFTNGSSDPWNLLSIIPQNGNTVNPSTSFQVIPGAAHCDDLRGSRLTDSAELKQARESFLTMARTWIGAL